MQAPGMHHGPADSATVGDVCSCSKGTVWRERSSQIFPDNSNLPTISPTVCSGKNLPDLNDLIRDTTAYRATMLREATPGNPSHRQIANHTQARKRNFVQTLGRLLRWVSKQVLRQPHSRQHPPQIVQSPLFVPESRGSGYRESRRTVGASHFGTIRTGNARYVP